MCNRMRFIQNISEIFKIDRTRVLKIIKIKNFIKHGHVGYEINGLHETSSMVHKRLGFHYDISQRDCQDRRLEPSIFMKRTDVCDGELVDL